MANHLEYTFQPNIRYQFFAHLTCQSWQHLQGVGDTVARIRQDVMSSLASLGVVEDCRVDITPAVVLRDTLSLSIVFTPAGSCSGDSVNGKIIYGANYFANTAMPLDQLVFWVFTPAQGLADALGNASDANAGFIVDIDSITANPPSAVAPEPAHGVNILDTITSAASTVQSTDPNDNNHAVLTIAAGNVGESLGLTHGGMTTLEIAGVAILVIVGMIAVGYALRPIVMLRNER